MINWIDQIPSEINPLAIKEFLSSTFGSWFSMGLALLIKYVSVIIKKSVKKAMKDPIYSICANSYFRGSEY